MKKIDKYLDKLREQDKMKSTNEEWECLEDNKKQFTIRIPYRVWDYLRERAVRDKRTVKYMLNVLLEEKVTEEIKKEEESQWEWLEENGFKVAK